MEVVSWVPAMENDGVLVVEMENVAVLVLGMEICCVWVVGMVIASVSVVAQDYEPSEYLEMVSGIFSPFVFLCRGKVIWLGHS